MSNSSTTTFLDQIPKVDSLTVLRYLQQVNITNLKYNTFLGKNRNDVVVSHFSVEQQDSISTLKASICLEESDPQKYCTITLIFDDKKQLINDIKCSDCPNVGCDHALAILEWTQELNEEKHENLLSTLKQPSKEVLVESLVQTSMNVDELTKSQNDQNDRRKTSVSIERPPLLQFKSNSIDEVIDQTSNNVGELRKSQNDRCKTSVSIKRPPLLQFKSNRIDEVIDLTSINAATLTKSQNDKGKKSETSVPLNNRLAPLFQFKNNQIDEVIDLTKPTIKRKRPDEYLQKKQNSCSAIITINPKKKQKNVSNARNSRNVTDLSLPQILSKCSSRGFYTADEFVVFAKDELDVNLCKIAEEKTRDQSKSSIWHKLRYGRITASKIYEASRCNVSNGSLVQTILGKATYSSYSMQRGQDLEDDVYREVQKLGYQMRKCGFYLHPDYPYLGASPDGIGEDFILEIKCPSSPSTFNRYLTKNGKITKKCKAQVLLQMMITGKSRGLFCVADPHFEYNKKIYIDWVDYDQDEMNEMIESAFVFWKNNIYPRLG